jgi:DegV family protein with EDD domain
VPINIHFGDETFRACVDINDRELFERVDREGVYPTSSAASPGQFAAAYEHAFSAGASEVLCFCVSGEVSATYDAALNACDMFPGRSIQVVDTRSLSMGQGFMVLAAAEALEAGASMGDAAAVALEVGARTRLFAALSTLKYLAMSGRVPALQAGVANLLNVKPILTLQDGRLDLLERVRTQKKAWARLIELIRNAAGGKRFERIAFLHINAEDESVELKRLLAKEIELPADILTAELTPGLSLFGGTGMVGAAFVLGD